MWTVEPLVLSVEERDELERRVGGLTTSAAVVCKWVYDARKAA